MMQATRPKERDPHTAFYTMYHKGLMTIAIHGNMAKMYLGHDILRCIMWSFGSRHTLEHTWITTTKIQLEEPQIKDVLMQRMYHLDT
jgi:hypothetical protein